MSISALFRKRGQKVVNSFVVLLLMIGMIAPHQAGATPITPGIWQFIDNGGIKSNTSSTNANYRGSSAVMLNGQLYVTFIESIYGMMGNSTSRVRVMTQVNGNWEAADGGTGLNIDNSQTASSPALAVHNNELYVIWHEQSTGSNKGIYVKKLQNGTWTSLSGGPVAGPSTTLNTRYFALVSYNGDLYASYTEFNGTAYVNKLKRYTGTSWVDDQPLSSLQPNSSVGAPAFATYNGSLYMGWTESLGSTPYSKYVVVTKRTANGSWVNVSGSTGIADSITQSQVSLSLQEYKGKLYATWRDDPAAIRLKAYDGDTWQPVGDSVVPTTSNKGAYTPFLSVVDNQLLVRWIDDGDMKTALYDGTTWTDASSGLENQMSDGSAPTLIPDPSGKFIYLFFSDSSKVRAAIFTAAPTIPAPTGVQVLRDRQSAQLSWTLDASVSEYTLYKGTQSGVYDTTPVATVGNTDGVYTVKNLEPGKTYYFAIKATTMEGQSPYSSEVSVTIPEQVSLLTGPTIVPGSQPGTIQITDLPAEFTYKYIFSINGVMQRPLVGDTNTIYTTPLQRDQDIEVGNNTNLTIVQLAGDNIVRWNDFPIIPDLVAQAVPVLSDIIVKPGDIPNTAKIAALPDSNTYKFAVGGPNDYKRPATGKKATELGYTQFVDLGTPFPATSNQYVYIVQVSDEDVVKGWAQIAVSGKVPAPVQNEPIVTPNDVTLSWEPVNNAIAYEVFVSSISGMYGPPYQILDGTAKQIKVTGLTPGVRYYFVIKAATKAEDSPISNETTAMLAQAPQPGTPALSELSIAPLQLSPAFSPDITQYTANVGNSVKSLNVQASVTDSVYGTVTASVYGATGGVVAGPYTLFGGSSSPDLQLAVGTSTITVTVTDKDGNLRTYTIVVNRAKDSSNNSSNSGSGSSGGSSGGGGGGTANPTTTTPTTPAPPTNPGLRVVVDGKTYDQIANGATTTTNGRTTMTATIDPAKLADRLQQSSGQPVIVVPVADKNIQQVSVVLTGETVKAMENKQAIMEVQTASGTYRLPADQVNVDQVSQNLGSAVKLSDIVIHVAIGTSSTAVTQQAEQSASQKNYTLVTKPISFEVSASYGGKTVNVDQFNQYVEREIPLPDGVDPSKVTTAVVQNADGTVHHVPTFITSRDGKFYAVINSLTNSDYSLIWHPKTFADVSGKWSEQAVNDMASRMIVNGVDADHYNPNAEVTRAELAAIMVRALGLAENGSGSTFNDVNTSDWYAGAVAQAARYGLIQGYADGSFGPDRTVTRQEALVMLTRAMKLAKLDTATADTASTLAPFADHAAVASWARDAVATAVQSGLVQGNSKGLAPTQHLSRAETAAIVQRLLMQAKLIDGTTPS